MFKVIQTSSPDVFEVFQLSVQCLMNVFSMKPSKSFLQDVLTDLGWLNISFVVEK